ncbi:MAG: hypothetical protein DWP95_12195 [Proteobacteria bacterium]|nr:MAG: hypothetical protein DWP95_12195 [Pseudomonadota bacterium]
MAAAEVPYAPELYHEVVCQSVQAFRKPFITVHLYNFYVLCTLVLLYVMAVVIVEFKGEGDLISAMFSGRKSVTNNRKINLRRNKNE